MTNLEHLKELNEYEISAVIYSSCNTDNVFTPTDFAKFLKEEYKEDHPYYGSLSDNTWLIQMMVEHPIETGEAIKKIFEKAKELRDGKEQ